jgi:hypothetical protein
VKTDIDDSRKRGIEKSGIGIKIIRIACFSLTVEKDASNCQLLKIVLSAMVITGPIG